MNTKRDRLDARLDASSDFQALARDDYSRRDWQLVEDFAIERLDGYPALQQFRFGKNWPS